MPPCQPARPVPARTAASRPANSSRSMVDIVMHCMIRSTPAMYSASAYTFGESSIRTS